MIAEIGDAIHVHNDTSASLDASSLHRWALALAALPAAGLIAAIIAPMSTPGAVLLIGVPLIAYALVAGGGATPGAWPIPRLAWALAAFGLYLAVNSLWAHDPVEGLGRAALFAALAALGLAAAPSLTRVNDEDISGLHRAVLVAVAAGALYLAIEVLLDQPIRKAIIAVAPSLRPSAKHVRMIDDRIDHIGLYTLNRNLAILNFLLWPAFLVIRSHLPTAAARLAAAGLLVLTAAAVFRSEHETSMLALAASLLVFAAMTVAARAVRVLVMAGWIIATLFVVPIADSAHQAGLHRAEWMPQTARNRIVLWDVTAGKVLERPLFGIGIGSTKPLDEKAGPSAQKLPGDDYPQRTGRHSHNIFMQTWFELGAVGAVLLLLIGLAALSALSRLPAALQPYAYASFVSSVVIGAFSWGMWQPWFMAAFGLWAIALTIGLDAAGRGDGQGAGADAAPRTARAQD